MNRKSIFFATLVLSLFVLVACKTAAPSTTSAWETARDSQTHPVVPQKPAEQLYVKATDRDFSFSYPQWTEPKETLSKNAIVQVSKDGCAVFLEATNVSYSTAFDSTLKFLKSGQGKEVKVSNVSRGIIEHVRWNKDRTQTFFSTTKFKQCNEFTYVVTITCDVTKIDTEMRKVFEKVINSVNCMPSAHASARPPNMAEAFPKNASINESMNEGAVENKSLQASKVVKAPVSSSDDGQ
ncbi:hypothetical protein HZB03_04140 [Candidatus Woesearchaeota archaeon]|nr:hypothetical protein [Candidatus Woesearchaeota archaeon]